MDSSAPETLPPEAVRTLGPIATPHEFLEHLDEHASGAPEDLVVEHPTHPWVRQGGAGGVHPGCPVHAAAGMGIVRTRTSVAQPGGRVVQLAGDPLPLGTVLLAAATFASYAVGTPSPSSAAAF